MSIDKTGQNEEMLWQNYLAVKSPATREAIILRYAPLVKYVAGRVAIGLPSNVEFDDLVSFGIFGLMDAIEKSILPGVLNLKLMPSRESGAQFWTACEAMIGYRVQ